MGYTPPPPMRKTDSPFREPKMEVIGGRSPSVLREVVFAKPERYPGLARAYKPHYLRVHAARCFMGAALNFGVGWYTAGSIVRWAFVVIAVIALVTGWASLALARDRERGDIRDAAQKAREVEPESYAVDYDLIESVRGEPFVEVYTTDYREFPVSLTSNGVVIGGSFETRIVGGDYAGMCWVNESLGAATWVHKLVVGALLAEQDPRRWEVPTRDPLDTVGEARRAQREQERKLKATHSVPSHIIGQSPIGEHVFGPSDYERVMEKRAKLFAHLARVKKRGAGVAGGVAAWQFQIENIEMQLDRYDRQLNESRVAGIGYVGESDGYPKMRKMEA